MLRYIRVSLGSCHQERGAVVLWLFARQVLHDRRLRSLHRFLVVQPANARFCERGRMISRGGEFNSCYLSSPSRTRFCDAREAEKGVTE
jgi:hypothetical protein